TTARSVGSPRPPTMTGRPASSGRRSTSTAARNWSMSTWSTQARASTVGLDERSDIFDPLGAVPQVLDGLFGLLAQGLDGLGDDVGPAAAVPDVLEDHRQDRERDDEQDRGLEVVVDE